MTDPGAVSTDHVWNAVQRYILWIALLMLMWEVAQLPLYTIWTDGSWQQIFVAVVHCTAGDIVIALTSLILAILTVNRNWPNITSVPMVLTLVAMGLGYTFYSEAYNLARGTWGYTGSMPRVPWFGIGLSPILQWTLAPPLALFLAVRAG